jgi:preprotein translocase subunit SecE
MNRKKLLPTFAWICLFVLGAAGIVWLVDSILAAFP